MFVAAFGAFQGKIDGARQVAHARRDQQHVAATAGEGIDGNIHFDLDPHPLRRGDASGTASRDGNPP